MLKETGSSTRYFSDAPEIDLRILVCAKCPCLESSKPKKVQCKEFPHLKTLQVSGCMKASLLKQNRLRTSALFATDMFI